MFTSNLCYVFKRKNEHFETENLHKAQKDFSKESNHGLSNVTKNRMLEIYLLPTSLKIREKKDECDRFEPDFRKKQSFPVPFHSLQRKDTSLEDEVLVF
ncbi:hypothetical protein CEXT_386131 [Caerostris extrusa]|uniref:Ycf1 n=1 Tax=Caerostris extrusa TaxID=172846 RepID=A0AAV4QDD5_CAEEX|nr:hypothetical protein CEXT_386131 [Caerostris extrusa]